MKKVLSVVLVLAMILGSFSMVFASDYSDVKNSDSYSEAVSVLSGLDVIGGYADGTFRPEGVVTRAEMATMIVNALGIPVKGGAATQFSDVPASHWASGFISYAASVGFIAGYTDGTFQPEKTVSYNEAITMIVAALGYKADALVGTYPGSFINKATSLGILDNCKTTGTIGANRGDIAQMLYDAMDCAIGYTDKDGQFIENVTKVVDGVGVVFDTMFGRLKCAEYNKGNEFVVTGKEKAAIALAPYVGKYATATKNADGEIISINVVSETYEGELDGTSIGDYDIKGSVSYAKDDAEVTGSTAGIVVFENGGYKEVKANIAGVANGTYTFEVKTSGKYITEIYSASKWDITKDGIMDEADVEALAEDNKLLDKSFEMDDNKEIDTTTFILEGVDSLADIKEDDVVYVYCYPAGAEYADKIAKVAVGTEVITGEVTKISSDTKDFTIGGKVYNFADTFVGVKPAIEDTIKAQLDVYGDIYKYEVEDGDVSNYAVVLDRGSETSKYGTTTVYLNLLLADGTEKEFEVKSTAKASAEAVGVTSGALVSYNTNTSEQVTAVAPIAQITATTASINAKGVFENKVIKDTTVIFSFEGDDKTDSEDYSVLKASAVMSTDPDSAYGEADDNGVYKVLLLTGLDTDTVNDTLAVIIDHAEISGDYKYEIVTMFEGAEKTFVSEEYGKTVYTTASANMYKLTFDADGGVSKVESKDSNRTLTGKTTVDGSILTNGSNKITLADGVTVYVYDESDEVWTKGTEKSCALKDADCVAIHLFETDKDTDGYEYVLVIKK